MSKIKFEIFIVNTLISEKIGNESSSWFTPPVNLEEIEAQIGAVETESQYLICGSYKCPINISREWSLDDINFLASELEKFQGTVLDDEDILSVLLRYGGSIGDYVEKKDRAKLFVDCKTIEDIKQTDSAFKELLQIGRFYSTAKGFVWLPK